MTTITNNNINAICFSDANTCYIGGAGGTLLKGSNMNELTAVEHNNNSVPNGYILRQNFPNPFNPSTAISFDLPADANVKLVVYDILGNEIISLVDNKFTKAGTYKITWNASSVSSGVYFYKLTAGEFTATKKMLLIK
jgi:hypothetical protein